MAEHVMNIIKITMEMPMGLAVDNIWIIKERSDEEGPVTFKF